MLSDPNDISLAHDRWGTAQVLNACAAITDEQFHQRFDIGPGSLHDTIAHIIGAIERWTEVLAGHAPTTNFEATTHTVPDLRSHLDRVADAFAVQARSKPLDATVTRERNGVVATFTRGAVITHVTTHGMYHRAQCLNMLRRLGISPLPPTGVTEWVRAVDSQATDRK